MSVFNTVEVIETVWIEMPDGIRLAARLWLPVAAKTAAVPALLEYIPYRRRDRTRARDDNMHTWLAAAGYACLRVDIRGSGDSDGLMEDEYSHQETQDGHNVIEWIAGQPWCDGNVGMFGKSWGAYNSFQVAATRPPSLKAIAPVMGCDDRWREDIHFYGGVLANDNFWWGSIMQLFNAQPPDPDIVGWDTWEAQWKKRLDDTRFWPAMWLEHQTHDEMWRRGSICENYDDVNIPVYYFGGWADLYRDTPFRIAEHLQGPVNVMMGPWAHLYPHDGIPGPKADFIDELIRFMDHHLRGKATGLTEEPPLRFYMLNSAPPSPEHSQRSGYWIEEAGWPSGNVEHITYYLNTGSLDRKAKRGAPLSVCSPQTFGSAGGDMTSFGIAGDTPADCRIDAAGAMVFRSEPLTEDIEILGQPNIALKVSSDQSQAFVAALLIDEMPDGTQALISRGFFNLMHREDDTSPKELVAGEEVSVSIALHAIGYRLPEGHRLMVQLASTYWPVLWPSPAPVTLTVPPGESALSLPVRRAGSVRSIPEPGVLESKVLESGVLESRASISGPSEIRVPEPPARTLPDPTTEQVTDGELIRECTRDATSGVVTERVFIDGGVFGPVGCTKFIQTDTVLCETSDRRYSIHPDDPLSARATMQQNMTLERGDWKVHIKCYAEQTATDTDFHLREKLECRSGNKLLHQVERTHKIPRNGM